PMINVSGITGAAPIWHEAMLVAEQGHPIRNFTDPGGLVRATVTYPDGVETTDLFLPGTVPNFNTVASPTPITVNNGIAISLANNPPPPSGAPAPTPYCPSYSFAFPPPPNNVPSPVPGWW
ncbi:MAG TPA: hypothetical protein VGT44_21685, partial [Ktedonobacteraceae bacterium]|nr:hypothetical protein [Ktedonobacteraceae bacterium]